MSFFAELKRRNVFKVAAAYIIIGWLIMQAGEVMAPALHLPEWINSALAFFLILGFPLAMFFAWAYEMTPEGIRKEKEIDRAESISQATGQKLNYTIIGLLVVALAYFVWESRFHDNTDAPTQTAVILTNPAVIPANAGNPQGTHSPTETPSSAGLAADKKSIAVIPFRNRSANEENAEFFSDGVHDELLTNLSKIRALKVISRTSVMSYRDTTKNMREIGEELGVANILEGGVQRAGDTVRINVQLIDAATDEHLWANVYDRQLSAENVFAIQTEIARAIANALEAALSPGEQKQLDATPTKSLKAYDDVLMARQLIIRGTWQNLRDAKSYLIDAIETDPAYVEAHVLLAVTYANLFSTAAATLEEIREPWEQAIQTALSLDDKNAMAHAADAQFLWRYDRGGVGAAFEKARQLEPGNIDIVVMYAYYLRNTYNIEQALPLYEMAREMDPVSIPVLSGLARVLEDRNEPDKALEIYTRIREIDPSNLGGYGPPTGIYILTGNMVEAIKTLFKAWAIDPEDTDLSNYIVFSFTGFSDFDNAALWLNWTEKTMKPNPMTSAGLARNNIYQGNVEAAMKIARQAFADGLPARWGSQYALIRTVLIWATETNQVESALEIIRQEQPELFTEHPDINIANVLQATDTAHLLQLENSKEEAEKLLLSALAYYESPNAITNHFSGSGKAQVLALLGQKQAALTELRHQVDQGWRFLWRWSTELNPNFTPLRNEPEYQAILEILRADMARQTAEFQALKASGEFPPPPEGDEQ